MDSDRLKSRRERDLEDLVRNGEARMKARREAEREATELTGEDPETGAVALIMFAREERDELRRELEERFGVTVVWERRRLRFSPPRRTPKALDQKARWVDLEH